MNINELTNYLDTYLRIPEIDDFGPQGLQVETSNSEIQRIALAVDCAPAVISAAADWGADMLLVHHGILWREVQRIAGPLGRRVQLLIENKINLYAAHLALDAHPEVGNNAEMAKMMDMKVTGTWCEALGTKVGLIGDVDLPLNEIAERLARNLHTSPRVLAHGPQQVRRMAIVTGFGVDRAQEAKAAGADTFLTGETSHAHFWSASDLGMNIIFGGHYATETVGVIALGKLLTSKFGLTVRFLDFPTSM